MTKAAVAIIPADQWNAILTFMGRPSSLYEDYRKTITESIEASKASGNEVVEVQVRLKDLKKWAETNNIPPTSPDLCGRYALYVISKNPATPTS